MGLLHARRVSERAFAQGVRAFRETAVLVPLASEGLDLPNALQAVHEEGATADDLATAEPEDLRLGSAG